MEGVGSNYRTSLLTPLVDRLRIGGTLHVATDIAEYATHTERVVAADAASGGPRAGPARRLN